MNYYVVCGVWIIVVCVVLVVVCGVVVCELCVCVISNGVWISNGV
jgi:hypothetical protein